MLQDFGREHAACALIYPNCGRLALVQKAFPVTSQWHGHGMALGMQRAR